MEKQLRWTRTALLAGALVLVAIQLGKSTKVTSSTSSIVAETRSALAPMVLEHPQKQNEHQHLTSSAMSNRDDHHTHQNGHDRNSQQKQPLSLQTASPFFPLVLDILSTGSNQRPEYLQAQKDTFGRHGSVRYFVGATEADDSEANCSNNNDSVASFHPKAISQFCKLPQDGTTVIHTGAPGSLLRRMRQRYAAYNGFLDLKDNAGRGWLCAQRRPMDALHRLLQRYNNNTTTMLPDYLLLMDDDTFVNLDAIARFLHKMYDSDEPLVMAGCLIRIAIPEFMTIPFGGYGTFVSRGALKKLLTPIYCNDANNDITRKATTTTTATPQPATTINNASFSFGQNACHRLQQNLMDEQRYWRNGMTVAQLMQAYVGTHKFHDYPSWTNDDDSSSSSSSFSGGGGSFCVHSDWVWGYFMNYYNIGSHTGDPFHADIKQARTTSYRRSEYRPVKRKELKRRLALQGQCINGRNQCTVDSDICHYTRPDQMYNVTEQRRQKQNAMTQQQRVYHQRPMIPAPEDWSALWVQATTGKYQVDQGPAVVVSNDGKKPPTSASAVIPVFVYPEHPSLMANDMRQFAREGIQRAPKLRLASNSNKAPVWIIDVRRAALDTVPKCHQFYRMIEARKQQSPLLKVAFLYWGDDDALSEFDECFRATRLLESTNVYRYKKTLVVGRKWKESINFVNRGDLVNYGNWRVHSAAPVKPIHNYGVPRDTKRLKLLDDRGGTSNLTEALVLRHPRSTDVSHVWPAKGRGETRVTTSGGWQLRNAVSKTLRTISNASAIPGNTRMKTLSLQEHAAMLLDSKIVVISQNDKREDNHRLIEALASGALVLQDPVLALPPGLEDGQSLVVYHSLDDMVAKVRYYLDNEQERKKIALEGYTVAMRRYQSWHGVEKMVLEDMMGT